MVILMANKKILNINGKEQVLTDEEIRLRDYQKMMNTVAQRASFYRANPHRFVKDYLNINLHIFQQIILVMMNLSTNSMFLASRGIGKSFMLAVFCVVRCILYPGTMVVVTSKTRAQGYEILDKIEKQLMPKSKLLCNEIDVKKSAFNLTKALVQFRNGSYIQVVTANDNARHFRANLLVDQLPVIMET